MLFDGVASDLRARLPFYSSDWKEGLDSGYKVLAPAVFIFFASVIPALAFGEQIENDTDGAFNGIHVLVGSCMGGIAQAVVGGQPLLIVGVSEPTVLVYGFMYQFAKDQRFSDRYVSWCTCTAFFSMLFIGILAGTGSCRYISKLTRFAREVSGMMTAAFFLQQAIKGVVAEFQVSACSTSDGSTGAGRESTGPTPDGAGACTEYTPEERLVSGLWAVILAVGTVSTSLLLRTARSWRFFTGGLRSFLADYGVPLMVLSWSLASYALEGHMPPDLPRRLAVPDIWHAAANENWDTVTRLKGLSATQVTYAIVPALVIAVLYWFDHNVSSQMAQLPEFQLVRPPAYHWDMALLALVVGMSGLLGLPAANGVLPQAPMHTRSLITLNEMLMSPSGGSTDPSQETLSPGTKGGVRHSSRGVISGAVTSRAVDRSAGRATLTEQDNGTGQNAEVARRASLARLPFKDGVVCLNVKEQRLSNLLQSLLIGACIAATPVVRRIPRSVLWGYFAFMAYQSVLGSEFLDRLLLLATDGRKRLHMLEREHPAYLETVPLRTIAKFTGLQTVCLLAVWGITWAGVAGIAFPLLIIALIPTRQYFMPRAFDAWALSQLDASDFEEAPAAPEWVVREAAAREGAAASPAVEEYEMREALEAEMPGYRGVKHHLTVAEMQRRGSVAREDTGGQHRGGASEGGRGGATVTQVTGSLQRRPCSGTGTAAPV